VIKNMLAYLLQKRKENFEYIIISLNMIKIGA
jgi:hypothetical protein